MCAFVFQPHSKTLRKKWVWEKIEVLPLFTFIQAPGEMISHVSPLVCIEEYEYICSVCGGCVVYREKHSLLCSPPDVVS